MMNRIIVIGATSAIARATLERLVARHPETALGLIARDADKLEATADHLSALGAAQVEHELLDVNEIDAHQEVWSSVVRSIGGPPDLVLIAHGVLPDQEEFQDDIERGLEHFHTNATATLALAERAAGVLEKKGVGTLAVIGSVAGDRGRASNYLYGSAKAAVHTYCSGLRGRLAKSGVKVITVKPGFVDTPMTDGMAKNLLFATPERVARDIVRGIDRGSTVVYTPWYWRPIMYLLRCLPAPIFDRLPL